jgi:hypothetical protein
VPPSAGDRERADPVLESFRGQNNLDINPTMTKGGLLDRLSNLFVHSAKGPQYYKSLNV